MADRPRIPDAVYTAAISGFVILGRYERKLQRFQPLTPDVSTPPDARPDPTVRVRRHTPPKEPDRPLP